MLSQAAAQARRSALSTGSSQVASTLYVASAGANSQTRRSCSRAFPDAERNDPVIMHPAVQRPANRRHGTPARNAMETRPGAAETAANWWNMAGYNEMADFGKVVALRRQERRAAGAAGNPAAPRVSAGGGRQARAVVDRSKAMARRRGPAGLFRVRKGSASGRLTR
jgi:hypothetical protein